MKKFIFLLCFVGYLCHVYSQQFPEIGTQVWIEPGQTKEKINHWFETPADNNMKVARLFLMWNYIETSPGNYDFTLYDLAFDAAEKNGIKVEASLEKEHIIPGSMGTIVIKWKLK